MKPEARPVLIALSAAAAWVAALALGGCQAEKKAAVQGTAGGEVLPGSVSDAMLPVDSLRSQPPLAPKTVASGKAASAGKASAGASSSPAAEAATPDEPAAEVPKAEAPAAQ